MRLGPYEIVSPLGEGGMGEVYRAHDTRLGREVAIKVVAGRLENNATASARFDREWRAVARLSHPNILSVHDIGHHDGTTFAVMELVPGESLRRRLAAGPLSAQKALEVAIQIARGLDAAHQAGIVHRDLKPENIVITPDRHVKILDFGVARLQDHVDRSGNSTVPFDQSESGIVLGTRGYMAPEQARGEVADHRADIFAFGAVLYEMLAGKRAFSGSSPVEVLHAVIATDPDSTRLSSTNPAVRRILARCLEKRREDRFSSAHDLAFALEAAAEAVTASGSNPIPPLTTPVWKRRAMIAVAGALVLAAAVRVGQILRPGGTTRSTLPATLALRAEIPGPPGMLGQVAFSPDGRRLAAIAYPTNGVATVWVRDVDGREWRRVAEGGTGFGTEWCEWSPDSSAILIPVSQAGAGGLRIVNVMTGVARTMGGDPQPYGVKGAPGDHNLLEANVGGAWSAAAGVLIGGERLHFLSAETGRATDALDADPAVTWQRWPSYLADGRSFLFTQESSDNRKRGIFLGQVGSPRAARILDVVGNARVIASGYLMFAQNGTLMAAPFDVHRRAVTGEARLIASGLPIIYGGHSWFSVSPADVLVLPPANASGPEIATLRVFERSGVQRRELGDSDRYIQIGLSADGGRLVIQTDRPALDVLEIERGLRVPLGRIPPGASLGSPAWSNDGRSVAATQYLPGEQRNLTIVDAATGDITTLLKTPVARWPQAWVRSRREIVAKKWEPGGTSLWAIPVDAPDRARLLSHEGSYTIVSASLSPDDRWLAYDSNETGTFEVYVQPLERPGERRRVSARGGFQPLWRDDGRELFHLEADGTLVAIPMSDAMVPSPPVRLFKLRSHPMVLERQYAPLAGGKHFIAIVPHRAEITDPITVLTNWTAVTGQ